MPLRDIFLRDNPRVTKDAHDQQLFTRDYFYKQPIELKGDSCIVDSSGSVLMRLFSNIVPKHLMEKVAEISIKYRQQVLQKCTTSDSRGTRAAVKFGSYIERGGSGKIWTRMDSPSCPGFLVDMLEIGQFVSDLFSKVCVEVASYVLEVPWNIKPWETISLLFWNASSVSKGHRDIRDMEFSLVLPFGNFTGGAVDLPYLNAKVYAKSGDLYLINSAAVYHNVDQSSCDRQAFVFTNHTSVIKRFCTTINTSNLFQNVLNI